jgi:Spy/CpxP family protein refolding chaperone
MKFSRGAIAMYLGLVFASGAVLGAFGQRLYTASSVSAKTTRNPEEFRKRVLATMERRLSLTPEQESKVNVILDETRARFNEVDERTKPELKAIREEQQSKINAILTPAQQIEYAKMRQEREERQRQRDARKQLRP